MQLGAFTADVLVDGKPLEQYDVEFESPTKATCWIASEEGKTFSVQWECHEVSRSTDNKGYLWVDGIGCGSKSKSKRAGSSGVKNKAVLSEFVGETTTRELMFARLQLSDDDSLLNKEIPKMLGSICLTIRHGNMVKERRVISNRDLSVLDDKKFHERSKKATVHCVGFGPETARRPSLFRWRLIPNDDPELTFVFKYQPLSVLQANGIAPRPTSNGANPSHEISFSQRHLTTADDPAFEDIKPAQLNDRIQNLENELKRLRDLQSGNSEDQKPKRVKREEQSRPLFAPGEIIDLT